MSDRTDTFEWIVKIIETCTNTFHIDACDKLIEYYNNIETDEDKILELKLRLKDKWNNVHNVLH